MAASAAREWEPIQARDYWLNSGLAAGAFLAYTQIEQQSGNLGHANFLDDRGRDAFRFSSAGQRQDAEALSNVALGLTVAMPVLFDPALVWARDGNRRSAARIANINAQAFGLTAVLTGVTKALVGRERPYVRDCRRDPGGAGCADFDQDEGLKSFYSGHSVYAFTGAGLTCLHHTELALYGDYRDRGACGSAIGLATVVAVMRVAADKHFVTDVSTGAVIGLISGYLFPRWLHSTRPTDLASASGIRWLPLIAERNTYGVVGVADF